MNKMLSNAVKIPQSATVAREVQRQAIAQARWRAFDASMIRVVTATIDAHTHTPTVLEDDEALEVGY